MATYIALMNWTDQGIKNVKGSPERLDAARKLAKKLGCELRDFYMTLGAYDMISVLEAPNDDAVAKFVLSTASAGNIRTTTLKAFSEADYRKLLGAL